MKMPGSDKTPIMRRAKMMIESREILWKAIRDSPQLSSNKIASLTRMFTELSRQINKRTFTDEQVQKLLTEVKVYSRNYRRVGKKLKISKRAVKFILKQTKNGKAKNQIKKARPGGDGGSQTNIFEAS